MLEECMQDKHYTSLNLDYARLVLCDELCIYPPGLSLHFAALSGIISEHFHCIYEKKRILCVRGRL